MSRNLAVTIELCVHFQSFWFEWEIQQQLFGSFDAVQSLNSDGESIQHTIVISGSPWTIKLKQPCSSVRHPNDDVQPVPLATLPQRKAAWTCVYFTFASYIFWSGWAMIFSCLSNIFRHDHAASLCQIYKVLITLDLLAMLITSV